MKLSVKIAVFIFFTLHISALFAEADYNVFCRDKKTLNSAQIAFENQNNGEALKLAEEAKQIRKERNRYEISLLENSFKPAEVNYAGDSLADTLKVLADRQDYDAIEIIDWYSKIVRNFDFNDSKNKFMDYLRGISEYPEADYLIASIYKLEGEYEFAVRYYNQCLINSDVLDNFYDIYDILYDLADISYTLKNYEQYEKDLLLILAQDKTFKDKILINAMKNTISSNKKNCLEKFFQLYRNENANTLKAYYKISEFYRKFDINKALDTSMICVITAFTKINSVIQKRNPEYSYKNIQDFFQELQLYPDIIEWGIENDVWRCFYNLADDAYSVHYNTFAIQLFNVVKNYSPEPYWSEKSSYFLSELNNN